MAEHKDNQLPGPDGGAGLRWGVEPMCAVLSEHGVPISPSTYYEWITKAPTRRELRDAELVEIITAQREDKKTGSSCRPWGLASCGFDCVARATTWPAAPWSGSCAAKAGRVLATGLGTRPRSPTTPTRGTRIWLTVTSMHRHQIGCGWPTLRMCRLVVRLRRVRHRCLQPPDRGLACGHLDEHRAGPGRRRACFLHPRPGRHHQPARTDCPQRRRIPRRIQSVVATPCREPECSWSASTSAGVLHPECFTGPVVERIGHSFNFPPVISR